jgi:hypothetical protein
MADCTERRSPAPGDGLAGEAGRAGNGELGMPDRQLGLTSAVPSKYEPFCHSFEA